MESMHSFLGTVQETYIASPDDIKIDINNASIPIYNDNKNYDESTGNISYLGAIKFKSQHLNIKLNNIAYPFDKNNLTYPISGETVMILDINGQYFWLPYSVSLYPNYREDKRNSNRTLEKNPIELNTTNKTKDYNSVKSGTPNATPKDSKPNISDYIINEKIKFLKPREGDTIISGRTGNTIRFSEFFLTEDETIDSKGNPKGGTSSPSIFIRNKQNPSADNEPIGTLVDENIDRDGSSVYITSGKVKIPFKETIKKQKIAFTKYPNSSEFTGDQIFVNSDRIMLSAKSKEFIIFGKSNTGIITDGKFSVDSIGDSHIHSDNNIILQTKRNVIISTDGVGNIWLGEVKKTSGKAGESVQRAVLAGELIAIMEEMLDAINKMVFATGVGPTGAGPHNAAIFTSIKKRLGKIQSSRTFLSK
jgi:hypothetical protein